MDSRNTAQDVLRCHLCETPAPSMYCDICNIPLCIACVGDHLSDEITDHRVIPYRRRTSTPNCLTHCIKQCELHCVQCDLPICAQCISSGKHLQHKIIDIFDCFNDKKEVIQRDIKEFETFIYPQYQKISSDILAQKTALLENSKRLMTALDKQGEIWHEEIEIIIQKLKSYLGEFDSKHLALLKRQQDKITHTISEITECILNLKDSLSSNDVNTVSTYKSQNEEFKRLPPRLHISLPRFSSYEINKEQIYQQFGSLSFKIAGSGYYYRGSVSSPSHLKFCVNPRIVTTINTKFAFCKGLRNVFCLSDEEIWSSGEESIIRLFNLQGTLLKSIKTKSGNRPSDIAVTERGHLIYSDPSDRSVNMVQNSNTKITKKIRLLEFIPLNVCSAFFDDLLVMMVRDDNKESKVVRYTEFKEKHSIQFNAIGQPLYSSDCSVKYISENRNLDICVADQTMGAVVVVNAAGEYRFTYTGLPSSTDESFKPFGITTDNQGRILTADLNNNRIHVIDQNGHFLRYIDDCGLQSPWGVCLDTRDNLFVAENGSGKFKKIQYCS